MKIKRNDQVRVITGKDKSKSGKVLRVLQKNNKVLVEGINFAKRHTRKTQQDQKGGIVQKEAPIDASNLKVICPRCSKPTRIKFTMLTDGVKSRVCKKCEEIL